MNDLTQSYVINRSQLSFILLNHDELIHNQTAPFYLVIYSTNPSFTKISIYPVWELPVRKYVMRGTFNSESTIDELSAIIQEIDSIVLHSSGLVSSGSQFEYEIYLTGLNQQTMSLLSKRIAQVSKIEYNKYSEVPTFQFNHQN
jgi:hypothetical protein